LKKYWPTSRSRSEEGVSRRFRSINWRLPFSFRITLEGWIFILSVFLLLTAAITTGNNLLFLILSTLLSIILTSGIFARNSLRSVTVSLQVPQSVFEGERVPVKVSLRNQKRLVPALSIAVEDDSSVIGRSLISRIAAFASGSGARAAGERNQNRSVLRHPAYFPWIPPKSVRSELVTQLFPTRGLYRLEGFRISTRFPFGFFERGERVPADGQVWVYPSVHDISSEFHLLPFLPGRLESRRAGHGESLFAIRKHQEGESARLVDWKSTAKTGELMAREFARDEENTFCLLLDTIVGERGNESFEKAVSLAASLAVHFAGEGAEFELLTPREQVPRGIGAAHMDRVLRSLALVKSEPASVRTSTDLREELREILQPRQLRTVLSGKIFKIIITSKPRGSFTSSIWRSSHVIYFDEL
jgi:uncharacterized protein (DUF58 family)